MAGYQDGKPQTDVLKQLFVGGLHVKTESEGLKEYFSQFGEVVNATVSKDRVTGRSRGFGFVTFANADDVDKVQGSRPHTIDEKEVESKRPAARGEGDDAKLTVDKLFIGRLSKSITADDLTEYFSQFGNVVQSTVAMAPDTGTSKGFGFVTFDDYDAVDKAMLHKPHKIGDSLADVKKGLSKEQMQEVKAKQAQQAAYAGGGYGGYPSAPGGSYGGGGPGGYPGAPGGQPMGYGGSYQQGPQQGYSGQYSGGFSAGSPSYPGYGGGFQPQGGAPQNSYGGFNPNNGYGAPPSGYNGGGPRPFTPRGGPRGGSGGPGGRGIGGRGAPRGRSFRGGPGGRGM